MIFSGFVCPVLLRHAADAAQGKKEGVGAVSCCVAHSSVRSAAHGTKKHRVPPGGLDVDRQQQHPTIGSKQDSQTPSPTGGTWPEIKKSSTDGSSSTWRRGGIYGRLLFKDATVTLACGGPYRWKAEAAPPSTRRKRRRSRRIRNELHTRAADRGQKGGRKYRHATFLGSLSTWKKKMEPRKEESVTRPLSVFTHALCRWQ